MAVNSEDHKLQCFEFGGRLFGELMLTFGGSSSAGIYDDIAKLVKQLATKKANVDDRVVNQMTLLAAALKDMSRWRGSMIATELLQRR